MMDLDIIKQIQANKIFLELESFWENCLHLTKFEILYLPSNFNILNNSLIGYHMMPNTMI
jgi:hypothetical protein